MQVQTDFAALDAGHVQEIAHQRAHAARLILDCLRGFQLHARQLGRGERQGFRQTDQHGQRCAQIVRQRREQRIAQALGFHLEQRVLRDADVVHPLEGNRNQRSESVEQLPLLRDAQHAPVVRLDGQDPASLGGRTQRNVKHFAARQGIRAETRRLTSIERPLRCPDLDRQRRIGALCIGVERAHQSSAGIRQQQRGARAKCALDGLIADFDHLFDLNGSRQIACNFKKRARTFLAMRRDARLKTQAGGQLAGNQAHRQHDEKRQQVLHVAHGKRKPRRHEKKIKGADAEHGSQRGRPSSETHPDQHDAQYEYRHDIGAIEVGRQRHRQQRHAHAGDGGPQISQPFRMAPGARLGIGQRRRLRILAAALLVGHRRTADFDQVDIGRQHGQLLPAGSLPWPQAPDGVAANDQF